MKFGATTTVRAQPCAENFVKQCLKNHLVTHSDNKSQKKGTLPQYQKRKEKKKRLHHPVSNK